jgi:hypothetical protein
MYIYIWRSFWSISWLSGHSSISCNSENGITCAADSLASSALMSLQWWNSTQKHKRGLTNNKWECWQGDMSVGGHSAQNVLNHGEELLVSPPNFLTELQNTLCHAVKTQEIVKKALCSNTYIIISCNTTGFLSMLLLHTQMLMWTT